MAGPASIFHGVEVPETLLAAELQHHRAATIAEARAMAGRSLAARAVLLALARAQGLEPKAERNAQGQEETADEALIRTALSEAIVVDPPAEERIRAVYSEYGWSVPRPDHRADGARLPFSHVRKHIAAQLEARDWTRAAARYVDELLARSAASPRIKLNDDGGLDDAEASVRRADRLLGAALADAPTALLALPPDAKGAVELAAAGAGEDAAQTLAGAIRRFLSSANDEAWTQLISRLRDGDEPLTECLKAIVAQQFQRRQPAHSLIRMRNGARAAP